MSNESSPADPRTVFSALADIVYRGTNADEIYTAICVAATLLVPGCDHASLMLVRRGTPVTVAASDHIARTIDDIERATGEGPCLDALSSETAQIEPDFLAPSAWPALGRGVVTRTPVRGAMGFRLMLDNKKVGALNLFSDTPNRFDSTVADDAIVLTAFAAVTVSAIMNGEEADTLRVGLESNREIGKAIGLLMATHNVTDDQAFEMLRKTSQDMNVKIAALAQSVVAAHTRDLDA
ncbi:GAF and ANTAR domain-containing protein [Rhodococcus sp. BP-252]|uniref:GAF and ANTAR domain-containing protein n=1 Tax=unclassified Rhodococcus (in: high G+C Gram-positive bacteria) TaxID=192944 RepID=UPI001C9BB95D|nr:MULTISPECIES: GAF and ANTAR domain-containing protein [unclassified Rhodococcus (in: high G+C Gram-positive bacteria)]MBY6411484.1 GAF and ANTAR domain-containing protein [Rhodococcus sp. BP-320]MBY6416143.1 GAF and ANTAR domain-containing protein [Rhodococcus sp. BP-321]MBY6423533.1 GAF and ANTAR domain-containing protein [Rhodococcus sp. BP-324]MBY6426350.1 GAF and ANTAR domain-containing protein [Rhodococcus sp. BP-323]MBY6431109.1 GAF and ANTAR domain-containing protein [Rhodococcus sp.